MAEVPPGKLAGVRELSQQLHSLLDLVSKIDSQVKAGITETEELSRMFRELDKGLDTAHELVKALNRVALDIHLEIAVRKRRAKKRR